MVQMPLLFGQVVVSYGPLALTVTPLEPRALKPPIVILKGCPTWTEPVGLLRVAVTDAGHPEATGVQSVAVHADPSPFVQNGSVQVGPNACQPVAA